MMESAERGPFDLVKDRDRVHKEVLGAGQKVEFHLAAGWDSDIWCFPWLRCRWGKESLMWSS